MKKIYILGLALFNLIGRTDAQVTWDGGGTTNDWTDQDNWSGNTVPGSADDVIFDGTSTKNCNFDTDIQVNNFSINSGYTGTIDALATLPIILGNFSQAAGTFISTSDIASGGLTIGGNISLTGGTFTHNSGLVTLAVTDLVSSSISGAITFNQLTIVATGIGSGQRSVNFGTSTTDVLTLGGVNLSRLYAYQGSIIITGSLIILGTSTGNPTSNSGTFTFSGGGPITVTGSGAVARNKLPNLVFNTSGTISMTGHINVQGDWSGTQGTLNSGSSTVNMYGSSASISGANAAFHNLVIQSGAVVGMPSSAEVKLGGTLTRTGTLNFQTTTALGFNGSGAQSVNLAGVTLAAINCYATSSRNVTLSGAVIVLDSLHLRNNITFATGGALTLRATSALKARVGQIPSGTTVSGNVTVETLIPGGTTGWSLMGINGVQSQNISSWDNYPGNPNGLPMTCDGCTFGVAALGSDFYSIQGWDESLDDYDTTLTVSSPLTPGKGFWVYVGNDPLISTDISLSNTGGLVSGYQPVAVTRTATAPNTAQPGFNLVANPYASPIHWDKIHTLIGSNSGDLSPTIYTYDPDNGDSQFTADGNGGSGTGGLITGILAGGQGFYVESLQSSALVEFDEVGKLDVGSAAILRTAASPKQYFRLKINGAADHDDELIRFEDGATAFFDVKYDAHKLFVTPGYVGYPGSYDKYTSISTKDAFNEDYAIHTMPRLTQSLSVPVLVKVSTLGTYTISAYDFNNFTSCVGLYDKVSNSYHDLRHADYVVNISDTTSAPRFDLVLCRDESINTVGLAENAPSGTIRISQDQQGAFVMTAFPVSTKATISVYNLIGQKLMDDIKVEGTATSTRLDLGLHNQVVLIRVVTDTESSVKKMVLH